MPLPFLADSRNWWPLAGLIRREIQPLLPFHDLYLIPSSTAAEGEALSADSDPTPAFWCGPPEFNEASATLRLPLGDRHTRRLEIILEGVSWGPGLERLRPFLIKVVQLVLEKAYLLAEQRRDPDTRVLNQYHFFREIREKTAGLYRQGKLFPHSLYLDRPESETGSPARLGLLTLELFEPDPALPTGGSETETFWIHKLARTLETELPWPASVGRIAPRRFSLLWEAPEATDLPSRLPLVLEVLRHFGFLPGPDRTPGALELWGGFALFPDHFQAGEIEALDRPLIPAGNPPALERKAEQALELAREQKNQPYCSFLEVLQRGGKVKKILGMNRLVTTLGYTQLACLPMFFGVSGNGVSSRPFKAVVSLNEVFPETSLAEVCWINDPLEQIQVGDTLSLLKDLPSSGGLSGEAVEQILSRSPLDPDTGLPTQSAFLQSFRQDFLKWPRFGLALIRIRDLQLKRDLLGRLEFQRLIKKMIQACAGCLAEPARLAQYSFDTLILVQPESPLSEVREAAECLKKLAWETLESTVNIGIAGFPYGPFEKSDVWENALKALAHAWLLGPGAIVLLDDLTLNISGDQLFDQGKIEAARRDYQRGLVLNADNPNLRNSLGVCYGNLKDLRAAVAEFEQVLKADPQNYMALYNLGLIALRQEDPARARAYFEQAREADEDHFEVHYRLGKLYRDAGLIDQSLDCFRRAQELRPEKTFIQRYLGEAWLKKGDWDQALSYFKGAVKTNPRDAYSLNQLGALYLLKEINRPVALSIFRTCTEMEPGNALFRLWHGRALLQDRDYEAARGELTQAWDLGEHNSPVCYYLGLAYEGLQQPAAARRWWEEALALDPGCAEARRKLEGTS
ncbi:MAG: tetratricopeptide repeat protein [Deltaproteobacteria bacterium]|nr:tetratricopeptide repeat protein [Deltaproteobacteria bacterium]